MTEVIVLTKDQLQNFIDSFALKVETIIKDSQKKEITSKEWLTAAEVAALLKISLTTIHQWSKEGRLIKHKIGNRIRFRHDQVMESLHRIESKNRTQ